MEMHCLSPEASLRLLQLGNSSYRPKEIIELRNRIEGETRAAELRLSVTGLIDQSKIDEIVLMKLELDGLYGDWAKGRIE